MKQLQTFESKNRFDYQLVRRSDRPVEERNVAIYKQIDRKDQSVVALEVFIIPLRKNPVKTPSGIILPPGEKFPSNEQFGTYAATVMSIGRANQLFDQYLQHIIDESKKAPTDT